MIAGWDTPDTPETFKPEGTCTVCNDSVSPLPGRAGNTCPSGHYNPDPLIAARLILAESDREQEREKTEPARRGLSVTEIMMRDVERDRIRRCCETAISALDASQDVIAVTWDLEVAATFRAMLRSIADQCTRADTVTLDELDRMYRETIADPRFIAVSAAIQESPHRCQPVITDLTSAAIQESPQHCQPVIMDLT